MPKVTSNEEKELSWAEIKAMWAESAIERKETERLMQENARQNRG